MTVDNNVPSPYRDRIYVTWTEFAADGTAYIYEVHSRRLRPDLLQPGSWSAPTSPPCTNTFGVGDPERQLQREPVLGSVRRARRRTCTWPTTTSTTRPRPAPTTAIRCCWPSRPTAAQSFSAPGQGQRLLRPARLRHLPGPRAPTRAAPASRRRARRPSRCSGRPTTPPGEVDPQHPDRVVVDVRLLHQPRLQGVKRLHAERLRGRSATTTYTGVKIAGACNNKILVSVSTDGAATFSGTNSDPRHADGRDHSQAGRRSTDQFWQWSAFTRGRQAGC